MAGIVFPRTDHLFVLFLILDELTSQQCGIAYYSVYKAMLKDHTLKGLKVRPESTDCRECIVDVRCHVNLTTEQRKPDQRSKIKISIR